MAMERTSARSISALAAHRSIDIFGETAMAGVLKDASHSCAAA
jgi:hypothetical protein